MIDEKFFRNVPMPSDLTKEMVKEAMEGTIATIDKINEAIGLKFCELIQSNMFSGVVSNIFTAKLGKCSPYKPNDEKRYPDLIYKGKEEGLEVKASNKPMKGGEGHNGHSGWHIVVCYRIQEDGSLRFTQVEIAKLVGYEYENSDWKYQGSKRNDNDSQRTETYITNEIGTTKLRDGTMFLDPEFVNLNNLEKRRRKVNLEIPEYSPFFKR